MSYNSKSSARLLSENLIQDEEERESPTFHGEMLGTGLKCGNSSIGYWRSEKEGLGKCVGSGSASGKGRFHGKWNVPWRHGMKRRKESAEGKELSETTKHQEIGMRKTKKKGRGEWREWGGRVGGRGKPLPLTKETVLHICKRRGHDGTELHKSLPVSCTSLISCYCWSGQTRESN